MTPLPDNLKLALYWFVDAISKGLLDNESWDFEPLEQFENGKLDWDRYLAAINDPTTIKTVYTIWMNNIRLDENYRVVNEQGASFRAFQYLRTQFDDNFSFDRIDPPFTDDELTEAQL